MGVIQPDTSHSPASSIGKPKFEKDLVNDPFKVKCRQAFHGPQEVEIDGYLQFKYVKGTLKGAVMFNYNHVIENIRRELLISFPQIASFTLVPPDLDNGMSGALIILVEEKCTSKLCKSLGTGEMIQEKMSGYTKRSFQENLNKFMFVLEPYEDIDNYFQGNLLDETVRYFPFSDLAKRFDWVIKSRSADNKRGLNNSNGNVFEMCTEEGFAKYLDRNRLKLIPYNSQTGANYVFELPIPKVISHSKEDLRRRDHRRLEQGSYSMDGSQHDENAFFDRSTEHSMSDYMMDDYSSKGTTFKKHIVIEGPDNGASHVEQFRHAVISSAANNLHFVRFAGTSHSRLLQEVGEPVAYTENGARATKFISEKKHVDTPGRAVITNVSTSIGEVLTTRRQSRRKVETISLSDDEGEEQPTSNSPKAECSQAEPPEKKVKLSGDTPLVRFPPMGANFVEVQFDDFRVLAHGEMLNDTIVEFYMKYVIHRLLKKTDASKIHVFNTFFYQKLTDRQPPNVLGKSDRAAAHRFNWIRNNYKFVKSWTKKANIFQKDYIIVPINDDMHWYVIIIIKPALAVKTDVEPEPTARKRGSSVKNPATHILVLDSLRDSSDIKRQCVVDILRDYLECELEDKKTIPGNFIRTELGPIHPHGLPRQQNYIDCGLFLLGFVEEFLTKPLSYETLSNPDGSWKVWYPHFNVKMKYMREKIVRFISKLAGSEKMESLKNYEKSQGRGATVQTLEGLVDEARRPRRHSITGYFEKESHPNYKSRCPSEPPDPKNYPPPAGITVSKK